MAVLYIPTYNITEDHSELDLKGLCLNAGSIVSERMVLVYMANDINPDFIGLTET